MHAWHQSTWEEIGHLTAGGMDAALLPVGAVEQHGPHLGCGMDAELATALGQKVAQNSRIMLLPTLPYGCSLGHSKRWPGTISLQPKTLIDVVKQIGDWVYDSGFRRLFILNCHVTNAAPLRCALEMLRAEHDGFMVAVLNSALVSERVKQAHFADGGDWHANDAETGLMMAIAPQMVRADCIGRADDPDRTEGLIFAHPVNRTSTNGVTGTPSLATAQKGETLFKWMVEDVGRIVETGLNEKAPLSNSYYEREREDQDHE